MARPFLCLMVIALAMAQPGPLKGAMVCVQKNGVEMCTVDKGFCHSAHIFGQSSRYAMDGLYFQVVTIRIRNLTTRGVNIAPENFQGTTETGERYAVDRSLHDSINWPQKLVSKTLPPNETLEGDLLFPVIFSPVRRIVHNGWPYMEIFLY